MGIAPVTKVAVAPSPATSGDSLQVITGSGIILPEIPFVALVWPENTVPVVGSNAEQLQVIGRNEDTLVLVRSAPIAISAGMMFAAISRVPNYERGTPVTMIGHFGEDKAPYTLHVCEPSGGTAIYTAVEDDGIGNPSYEIVPGQSGLWAFRWEGAGGMLEDQAFFVNYSPAL